MTWVGYKSHLNCTHPDTSRARKGCRMGWTEEELTAHYKERAWERSFGGTRELFNQLWKKQKGRCPICQRKLIIGKHLASQQACWDHCHVRNIPRGILCRRCNIQLGWFEEFSSRIVSYVDEYKEREV